MRLSLWANGRLKGRRFPREETARAVWHPCGARVARQRCPILRKGGANITGLAVGCKALNAMGLGISTVASFTTFLGGEPKKDYVAKGIEAFQKAAQQGFLMAFTCGLGQEVEDEGGNERFTDEIRKPLMQDEAGKRRFSYLLSIFLICAEKHSYFYAHDGYDAKKSKVWMTRPPEFDRPLGAPKGPAVRSGYICTREFAHASVRLDVEKQTGDIVWKTR